jgi:membrane protein
MGAEGPLEAPVRSPIPTEPAPISLPDFVPRSVGRLLDRPRVRELRLVLEVYGRAGGGLLAAGIAYRVLFAVAPAVLLFVALLGFVVADDETRSAIVEALGRIFPPLADILDSSLEALAAGAVSVSIISAAILLWGASGLYVAIEEGIVRMVPFGPPRDPARRTALGLLAVVVLLGAAVAVFVAATLLDMVGDLFGDAAPVPRLPIPFGRAVGVVGSAILVAAAYRYLPTTRPPWRVALVPGMAAGAAIALLTILYVVIAPWLAGLAFLYGSLATVLVTLAWVGIVSQVLLVGAAWTAVRWSRAIDAATGGG